MTNFNPLININLFQNLQNIKTNVSNTPAQIVQQNLNGAAGGQTLNQNSLLLNQQTTAINPSLLFSFETLQMDNETVTKYLQGLLNMPDSIDKFIKELDSQKLNPRALNVLVKDMVNLKALGELLNDSSKEAIQKLMQTLATLTKSAGTDTKQLKEILGVLNSIQASTNLNTNSLKELLLLYIPIDIQAFNKEVDFKEMDEEDQSKVQSSAMSLMIETINFSSILCLVNENENSLYIEMNASEKFTFDKFQSIIQALSKEVSIKTYVEFRPSKKYSKEGKEQNFKVVSGGYVSINTLILAHIIIKTIFKIDSDFSI